jgi:hypothetical protein
LYVSGETVGVISCNESAYSVTRTTLVVDQIVRCMRFGGSYPTLNVSMQNMKFTKGIERTPNAFAPMSA